MKLLTPEDRQRLKARYDMLDQGYRVLRECAGQQRLAILRGDSEAVLRIDITLMATSVNVGGYWSDIQSILMPPAAQPEPAPMPPKETVQ